MHYEPWNIELLKVLGEIRLGVRFRVRHEAMAMSNSSDVMVAESRAFIINRANSVDGHLISPILDLMVCNASVSPFTASF
jgi:hypothetical protein